MSTDIDPEMSKEDAFKVVEKMYPILWHCYLHYPAKNSKSDILKMFWRMEVITSNTLNGEPITKSKFILTSYIDLWLRYLEEFCNTFGDGPRVGHTITDKVNLHLQEMEEILPKVKEIIEKRVDITSLPTDSPHFDFFFNFIERYHNKYTPEFFRSLWEILIDNKG